jgi:menaquinone-dependent protoporphyrinogen oxidase
MKGIIIYTTKHGCTEKAVKLLQSKISEDLKTVNLEKEKAPDLSMFDTVIIGGSIYVGKTQKVLTNYMQQNLNALKNKRLGLFLCAGEQNTERMQQMLVSVFPEDLYKCALVREVFGGELYWNKLDFVTKLMLRIAVGIKEGYSRLSEAKINSFAKEIMDAQAGKQI